MRNVHVMRAALSVAVIAKGLLRPCGNPALNYQLAALLGTSGPSCAAVPLRQGRLDCHAPKRGLAMMRLLRCAAFVCLCVMGTVHTAAARTTATYGQNAVGQPCGRLENGADFDTLFQCTSSAAGTSGTKQTAPIILGTVTAPPYAATTCDTNKAGMIQWTGSAFQGCDGSAWNTLGNGACTGVGAFSFTDQTGVQPSTETTSNTQTLSGFACTASAVCSGCTILKNGTLQGTTANFVSGDQISIRLTSSATYGATATASAYVGSTNSGTWSVTTTSDVCSGTPSVGAVCSDGTVYAGLSPDGNVKMYTTRCDAGQTWSGSACTGTRVTRKWSYGTTIATGYTNASTGESNTSNLYALNGNADGPYEAATHCQDLVANSQSDWYLPARGELNVLYTGNASIGNFDTSGTYYWSSTEYDTSYAYPQRFSDGYQGNRAKNSSYLVRCVRR